MIKRVACVLSGLSLAGPSFACVIGDLSSPPSITITTSPADCCYGEWAGTVAGLVDNVDTDSVLVVLYARTNDYYIQPDGSPPWTQIMCPGGTFSDATRGGCQYWAILAKHSWAAPATLFEIPPVGGDILAFDCSVDSHPTGLLDFAERQWIVKACCGDGCGPGPNLFSDSSENVWVDEEDRLHLRLTERKGSWYCAEVLTDHYLGYGNYSFDIEGPIESLHPQIVVGGFTYSDCYAGCIPADEDEIDIEFSRWEIPTGPTTQYAVQPVRPDKTCLRHQFSPDLNGLQSSHSFLWTPDSIRFESWQGANLLETYTYTTTNPDCVQEADVERMRFNVWLFQGEDPDDLAEVEVVISNFVFSRWPSAVEPHTPLLPSLILGPPAPNPATGSIEYQVTLDRAARVTVSVYDAAGRHIDRILERELGSGTHSFEWSPADELPSGVYWLRLDAAGQETTRSFVVSR